MKLDEIMTEWESDSKIDKSELALESLRIPELHHKYYKIFTHEALVLRKLKSDHDVLKFQKWEFYTQGPTKETKDQGWEFPAIGKIIKSEVELYMSADPDIIKSNLSIAHQTEKVQALESILKTIANRTFQIKNAIEFLKFTNGT